MKRLLIVDDHAIVRQGVIRILKDLLGPSFEFEEAADGAQAINMAGSRQYDLVLLDISLPELNGLEVLKILNKRHPEVPVVMLSSHLDDHYAVRSLRAGAAGYVNKEKDGSVLQEAIEQVLAGARYVTPSQVEMLVESIGDRNEADEKGISLSDREYHLVRMMTSGKTQTEIAKDLSLSVKTISTYRSRILEKLQLKTTADIINYGIRNKLT